jgi:hypothetical protein
VLQPAFGGAQQPAGTPRQRDLAAFGYAVGFGVNVLAVGAPGALAPPGSGPDGEATGSAHIYERISWGTQGGYLRLAALAVPDAARQGDRVGLSVAAADHTVVIGSSGDSLAAGEPNGVAAPYSEIGAAGWDASGQPYAVAGPRHEVQILTLVVDAPAPGAGPQRVEGWFTVHFGHRNSRRLPWNAPARAVRTALEGDLGTGRVRVTRAAGAAAVATPAAAVPGTIAYQWRVTFLDRTATQLGDRQGVAGEVEHGTAADGGVELLQVHAHLSLTARAATGAGAEAVPGSAAAAAAELQRGANRVSSMLSSVGVPGSPLASVRAAAAVASIVVHRAHAASMPVRGAAYVYTRSPSAGYGGAWTGQAALSPFAHQASDQFGFAVALGLAGDFAAIGAPSRDLAHSEGEGGINAGVAFTYSLDFLNVQFKAVAAGSRFDPSDAATVPWTDEGAPAKGVASRGHHGGLGLTNPYPAEIEVCAPVCHVPPDAASVYSEPPGPSVSPSVGVYVTTAAGNDWGFYDTHGSVVPPRGPIALRAHAAPAVSAAGAGGGLGAFWAADGVLTGSDSIAWSLGAASGQAAGIGSAVRSASASGYVGGGLAPLSPSPSACGAASTGTQECHFVYFDGPGVARGGYDHAGVQDFVQTSTPVAVPLPALGGLPVSLSVPVLVHDDAVAEGPDETMHVRLALPGMHAMWGGQLWLPLRIVDDGDGGAGEQVYMQPLHTLPVPEDAAGHEFGAAVAVSGSFAVVGSPGAPGGAGSAPHVGAVQLWMLEMGAWEPLAVLQPGPLAAGIKNAGHGTAVALLQSGTTEWYAAASAPGVPTIAVFSWSADPASGILRPPALEAMLLPDAASAEARTLLAGSDSEGAAMPPRTITAADGFGARGALAFMLDSVGGTGPILAVGCAGAEAVFVYRRTRDLTGATAHAGAVTAGVTVPAVSPWELTAILRAADYAEVARVGMRLPLPARFGTAVSASGTLLVVGAPQGHVMPASAPPPVPTTMANGSADATALQDYMATHGSGAVHVFTFAAGVAVVRVNGTMQGTWAELLGWPAADAAVAAGASVLVRDDGAGDAVWAHQLQLVPAGGRPGDQFGAAVSVDGGTVLVGAPSHAGQTDVTWDFETGDLRGWTADGDAFARQPTFGDNSAARWGYPDLHGGGAPEPARHHGRYYVGTYEARPADLPVGFEAGTRRAGHAGEPSDGVLVNFAPADVLTAPGGLAGAAQGDGPTGTLTSAPFIIGGPELSFLVGGGCDERAVYVELLVDGQAALRAAGACREGMQRVTWDVRPHAGKACMLRIVDGSSVTPWGHINVDDFRFAWDIGRFVKTGNAGGAYVYTLSLAPAADGADGPGAASDVRLAAAGAAGLHAGKRPTSSQPDASWTGAAAASAARGRGYASMPCPDGTPVLACVWKLDARLSPSEVRPGTSFGLAVAVDEASGIALVGAPLAAPRTGAVPPGDTDVVHFGAFGRMEASMRADGGMNLRGLQGYGCQPSSGGAAVPWADAVEAVAGRAAAAARSASSPAAPRYDLVGAAAHAGDSVAGTSDGGHRAAGGAWRATVPAALSRGVGDSRGGLSATGIDAMAASALGRGLQDRAGLAGDSGGVYAACRGAAPRDATAADNGAPSGVASAGAPGGSLASGAVYVFRSEPTRRGGLGELVHARKWAPQPHSTVDYPAVTGQPGGRYGDAVALSGFTALAGAPRSCRLATGGGAALLFDLGYTYLSFDGADVADAGAQFSAPGFDASAQAYRVAAVGSAVLPYAVPESFHLREIAIPVYRSGVHPAPPGSPAALLHGETLHVQYATRDVSAVSVSAEQAARCAALPFRERGPAGCGDYVQAAGEITFSPGVTRRDILVQLVDDGCAEPEPEFFTVSLYVPGGGAIGGHGYTVTVRIDDDDVVWAVPGNATAYC